MIKIGLLKMADIIINGNKYSGKTIVVDNNTVIVDGNTCPVEDRVPISISITGDVGTMSVDHCDAFKVHGNVGELRTISADVECLSVAESVTTTSGDISCHSVAGNVTTVSGDVFSGGDIHGNVKTVSGDISSK